MLKYLFFASLWLLLSVTFAAQMMDSAAELDNEVATETDLEQMEDDIESIEAAIPADNSDTFFESPLPFDEIDVPVKDVFLVLDNSGSMKKNDPDFLVSNAVRKFISLQDDTARVGIVIFDQSVTLPVPLTEASISNRELILNSLNKINYRGLFTDSPAGVERAIYELKNNGRDDAQKSIIFMTDGIVDTGDVAKDLEKAKWLREDLAPDAADNDIKIFGIAFTEQADFQLIQSIAQKTDGEYYRVLQPTDMPNVFNQINDILNTPPESVPELAKQIVIEAPALALKPPPPLIIEVPAQIHGQEERVRSMIFIAAAIILTITLLGILILLLKRSKELKTGEQSSVQKAYINDLSGKTDKQTHKLGSKPTMFSRVAGQDNEHLDYIVVNESTIGRLHALIEYKSYSYWIIDQGSINGTFVNEEPVKTEMRLKHGDKIRLHRCEFDFIMPEMEDSGMTVISNTVFAAQPQDDAGEATELKGDGENELTKGDLMQAASGDMDFNLTSPSGPSEDLSESVEPAPDFVLDEEDINSEDETTISPADDFSKDD